MRALFRNSRVVLAVALATFILSVQVSEAVDGQVIINQSRAGAGGVTPGDGAGFPVTISLPGSYRLSGNLTVPDQTTAIEVTADNVTLDLNGFGIIGPGVGGNGDGVNNSFARGTVVMNGSVSGMGNHGVAVIGQNSRVEHVMVRNNGATGIIVGPASTVVSNRVIENGAYGILALHGGTPLGNGGTVLGNTVRDNGLEGLSLTSDLGYAQNVLTNNNGGNANPQVSGGIQMGGNVCGTALCP